MNDFPAWPADDAAYGLGAPKVPVFGQSEYAKAQAREICAGIEEARSSLITRAFAADLQKLSEQARANPTWSRERRRILDDPDDIAGKLAAETEFSWEFIAEQWTRPEVIPFYVRIAEQGAAVPLDDLDDQELQDAAWLVSEELADVEDGQVRLLSDVENDSRRYPGAPVKDERAKIGKRLGDQGVRAVEEAWNAVVSGKPHAIITPEARQRMNCPQGIRISSRELARQANAYEMKRRQTGCKCTGRKDVDFSWQLRDHDDEACPCRRTWVSLDTARRAREKLTATEQTVKSPGQARKALAAGALDGLVFVRTLAPRLVRENHTFIGLPAAYYVPGDAGWHEYVKNSTPRRRRYRKAA